MALGKPKLTVKTPDDEDSNALLVDGVHDQIIRNYRNNKASDRQVAIVVFDTIRVTNDKGKGDQATIQVRHLELPKGDVLEDVENALIAAFQQRYPGKPMPGGDDKANQLDIPGMALGAKEAEAAKDAAFDDADPKK